MRALLFACALFCLLTVTGVPAAAFQRLGILPPGEDDCLMGSIVIELGSNLSADFPSKGKFERLRIWYARNWSAKE